MVLPTTNNFRQKRSKHNCVRRFSYAILFLLFCILFSIVYLFVRSISLTSSDSSGGNDFSSWSSKKPTDSLSFSDVKAGGKKVSPSSLSSSQMKKEEALRRRPPGLRTRDGSIFGRYNKAQSSSNIDDSIINGDASRRERPRDVYNRDAQRENSAIDTEEKNGDEVGVRTIDVKSSQPRRVVSSSKGLVDELKSEQSQRKQRGDSIHSSTEKTDKTSSSSASIPLTNEENAKSSKTYTAQRPQILKAPALSETLPTARTASASASVTNVANQYESARLSWPLLDHLASLLTTGSLDDKKLRVGITPEMLAKEKEGEKEEDNTEEEDNNGIDMKGTTDNEENSVDSRSKSESRQQTRRDFIKEIFGVSSFISSTSSASNLQSSSSEKGKRRGAASYSTLSAGGGSRSLFNGIKGPILASSLRSAFESDMNSKTLVDALLSETVPSSLAEPRSPCFIQNIVPITPPAALPSLTPVAPVQTKPINEKAGTAAAGGRVVGGSNSITLSTVSSTTTEKIVTEVIEPNRVLINDQLRLAVSRLAEIDYRLSVAQLLSQMSGAVIEPTSFPSDEGNKVPPSPPTFQSSFNSPQSLDINKRGGSVPQLAQGLSLGSSVKPASITSLFPSSAQPSPSPLVSLSAENLPPRPFIAHDGRLDVSKGRPIFVVGAGPGLFSLRVASSFRNTSILSLTWPERSTMASTDDEISGYFSTSDIHSLLKSDLGAESVGNSWVLDASVDPSSSRARTLSSYTRSFLFSDPKNGGLLPSSFLAKSRGQGKKKSLADCLGGGCEDGDGSQSGYSGDEKSSSKSNFGSTSDTPGTQYDLAKDISPPALRRLARSLNGEAHAEEDSTINFDLLVLSDLAKLISTSTSGRDSDSTNDANGVMLPFEFEKLLGELLTLSRVSLVAPGASGSDVRGLPSLPFFNYWPSLEALIRASVEAVGMVPTIRSVGSSFQRSSFNGDDSLGVLVSVQTPAEALYEASLYEKARLLSNSVSAPRGSAAQKDSFIPPAPGSSLGRRAVPGFVLNFCPDMRPRARRGAMHPSSAWGEFGRGAPLSFIQDFGLSASDASSLAAQVASADLPTRHLMPLALSSRQGGGRLQGNGQPWVLVGSKLLLSTDSKPAKHEKVESTTNDNAEEKQPPLIQSNLGKNKKTNEDETITDVLPSKTQPLELTSANSEDEAPAKSTSPRQKSSGKTKADAATISTKPALDKSRPRTLANNKDENTEENTEERSENTEEKNDALKVIKTATSEKTQLKATKRSTTQSVAGQSVGETSSLDKKKTESSSSSSSVSNSIDEPPKQNSLFSRKQSKTLSAHKSKKREDLPRGVESEDTLLAKTDNIADDAVQAEEEAQEAVRAAKEASTRAKKLRAKAAVKALQDSMLNAIEDDSKTSSSETENLEPTLGKETDSESSSGELEPDDTNISDEEMTLLSNSQSKDNEDDSLLLKKGRLLLEDNSVTKQGLSSKSSLFTRMAGNPPQEGKESDQNPGPLLPHLVDTRWANIRPLRAPSLPPSRAPSLDTNVRIAEAKEQSALVARETDSFKAWWKVLRAETMRKSELMIAPKDETYSILVQGSSISLLTAKIARVHPLVTILTVVTDSSPSSGVSVFGPGGTVDSHNDLMRLIGARNNFVVSPLAHSKSNLAGAGGGGISPEIAKQLSAADDPVRYAAYVGCNSAWVNRLASNALSILSTSTSSSRLSSREIETEAVRLSELIANSWEEQLGDMLLIAGTSFIELPPFSRLLGPLLVLSPKAKCVSSLSGDVIPCAFFSSEGEGVTKSSNESEETNEDQDEGAVTDFADTDPKSEEWKKRIELAIFQDEAGVDEDEDDELGSVKAASLKNAPPPSSSSSSNSISLFSRTNPSVGKPSVRESSLATVYEIIKTLELSTKPRRFISSIQTLATRVVSLVSERYSPKAADSSSSIPTAGGGFSRSYEPFRRLVLSAALRSGLTEPEARFIATERDPLKGAVSQTKVSASLPLVILRVDAKPWAQIGNIGESNEVSQIGVSLHTLLTIGTPSALRARLLRLHLALPITAIARAALNRGLSLERSPKCKTTAKASDCDTLAIAPTDLRLVPSAVFPNPAASSENDAADQACAFELVYTLPGKPRATFHSSLCLVDPLASFTIDGEPSSLDLAADGSGNTIGRSSLDLSDSDSSIIETWAAVASQLTPLDTATGNAQAGRFSFVDHGSGLGELSLAIARAFPEATVLSIDGEGEDEDVSAHLAASLRGGIFNNVIAKGVVGSELFKRLYDSPEFFRYQSYSVDFSEQLLRAATSGRRNFEASRAGQAISGLQSEYGTLLALAATTFLKLPSELHLSLAFTTFADSYSSGRWLVPGSIGHSGQLFTRKSRHKTYCSREPGLSAAFLPAVYNSFCPENVGALGGGSKTFNDFISGFSTAVHPRPAFESAEVRLLSSLVRAPLGSEAIRVVAAPIPAQKVLPSDVDAITPRLNPLTRLGLGATRANNVDGLGSEYLPRGISSGIVRVDLVNLVRHVNHHFQSDIDGHSRKYTLRVKANYTAGVLLASMKLPGSVTSTYDALPHGNHPNHGHTVQLPQLPPRPVKLSKSAKKSLESDVEDDAAAEAAAKAIAKDRLVYLEDLGAACDTVDLHPSVCQTAEKLGLASGTVIPGVTSIILTRDTDGALIPYDSVHGITLITGLRLGLLAPLRQRAYHQFVSLPLYQDMAPWNIVFLGPRLDYIDYDTRDRTYDLVVPKAYEVMEVLFNYKRTVEDFKRCNGKAGNPYNFPFVSDCVSSPSFTGPCKESQNPVPCGDGTCRSDYVSCLRALSEKERTDSLKTDLLWAFRAYEDARGAEKLNGRGSTNRASIDNSVVGSDLDLSPAKTYLTTLFGDRDRSLGASESVKKAKRKVTNGDDSDIEEEGLAEGADEDRLGARQRRKRSKRLKSAGTGDEGGFLGGKSTLDYGVNGVIKPQLI